MYIVNVHVLYIWYYVDMLLYKILNLFYRVGDGVGVGGLHICKFQNSCVQDLGATCTYRI